MHDTHAQLEVAVAKLRRGELVAFPTETVYGLGAAAFDEAAVAKVFETKSRPSTNPLIVHVASVDMARTACTEWPEHAQILAEAFWPGPLSIVVRRSERVPASVAAGGPTVCLRMPAHPLALALIEAFGEPIIGPSANRSGHVSPTTAEHVRTEFPDVFVLDGGPCRVGIESTVVDVTSNRPAILRPGAIGAARIETVLGVSLRNAPGEESIARSPGLLHRHYAPRTPTLLCEAWSEFDVPDARVVVLTQRGADVPKQFTAIHMPSDAEGYAALLYDALRRADAMGTELIIVERPSGPGDMSLWVAIGDRLERASAQDKHP
ncbi:MAG: threonylcarbamoyl-AMP synthase [Phycisphaeraceae bacterium]|nr:threonylcarbamoyl-AMP synthase [Phycisphaeraceae bacterium]MCW5762518.1 threonylcarbamoyl-AMP synthase [Phycisphaeraceae bacterium]